MNQIIPLPTKVTTFALLRQKMVNFGSSSQT